MYSARTIWMVAACCGLFTGAIMAQSQRSGAVVSIGSNKEVSLESTTQPADGGMHMGRWTRRLDIAKPDTTGQGTPKQAAIPATDDPGRLYELVKKDIDHQAAQRQQQSDTVAVGANAETSSDAATSSVAPKQAADDQSVASSDSPATTRPSAENRQVGESLRSGPTIGERFANAKKLKPQARSGKPGSLFSTSSSGWVLQTLTALGVVIFLIFMLRWLIFKMNPSMQPAGGGQLVEVLCRSPIGNKAQVILLRINQRVLVVGQTGSALNTICEISDETEIAQIIATTQRGTVGSLAGSFKSVLGELDRQFDETQPKLPADDDQEQYMDRARYGVSGLLGRIRTIRAGGLS